MRTAQVSLSSTILMFYILLLTIITNQNKNYANAIYSKSRKASNTLMNSVRQEKQKKTHEPTTYPTSTFHPTNTPTMSYNPTLSDKPTASPSISISQNNMITIAPSFTLYFLINHDNNNINNDLNKDDDVVKIIHEHIMDYLYILEQSFPIPDQSLNDDNDNDTIDYGIDDNDITVTIINETFVSSYNATKLCNEGALLLLRGGINNNSNNSTYVSNKILKLTFSVSFTSTQQDTHEEIDDDNYDVNITKEMISTINMISNTSSMSSSSSTSSFIKSAILKKPIIEKAMLFWSDNVFGVSSSSMQDEKNVRYYEEQKMNLLSELNENNNNSGYRIKDISTSYNELESIVSSLVNNCNTNTQSSSSTSSSSTNNDNTQSQQTFQQNEPISYSIKNNTVLYNTIFIICIIIIIMLGLVIIGYFTLRKNKNIKDLFQNNNNNSRSNTIFVTRTITETSSGSQDNDDAIVDVVNNTFVNDIELNTYLSNKNNNKQQAFRKSKPKRKKKKILKKKNSPIKNLKSNKLQLSLPTINEVSMCESDDDSECTDDSNASSRTSDDSDDIITGVTTLLYEDDGFITNDVVNLSSLQFLQCQNDNNDRAATATMEDNNSVTISLEDNANTTLLTITEKLLNIHNDTAIATNIMDDADADAGNNNNTIIDSSNDEIDDVGDAENNDAQQQQQQQQLEILDNNESNIINAKLEGEDNGLSKEIENSNDKINIIKENYNNNSYDTDDISYVSDVSLSMEEEIDLQSNNNNYQEIDIIAPAGHLYLDINSRVTNNKEQSSESCCCYVHNVKKESPLHNMIQINDIIIKIDEVNVIGWNAVSISMLLSSRATLSQRVIIIHRCLENINDNDDDSNPNINSDTTINSSLNSSNTSASDLIIEYDD